MESRPLELLLQRGGARLVRCHYPLVLLAQCAHFFVVRRALRLQRHNALLLRLLSCQLLGRGPGRRHQHSHVRPALSAAITLPSALLLEQALQCHHLLL